MNIAVIDYLDRRLGAHVGEGEEYVRYNCPMCYRNGHGEDSKHHLYAYHNGTVHCFKCGYHRGAVSLIATLEGKRLTPEFLKELRDQARAAQMPDGMVAEGLYDLLDDYFTQTRAGLDRELIEADLPKEYVPLDPNTQSLYERLYLRYLYGRGITPEQIVERQIGYCFGGKYENMIVFPVTYHGRVVYFTTRYRGKSEFGPKSLNPNSTEVEGGKGMWLYGFDQAMGREEVTIVEGPMDALHTAGGLAVMGKTISSEQVMLLSAIGAKRLHVCLDGDAVNDGWELSRKLHSLGEVILHALPNSKDPADVRGRISECGVVLNSPADVLVRVLEDQFRGGR